MSDKVEFTEEAIKEYLDSCIKSWRDKRDDVKFPEVTREMAKHYIDAFQSVRISIFGELLES